jgi:hypothetical protein
MNIKFKIIVVFFSAITLVSCRGYEDSVIIPKQEYERLIGDTIKPKYPKPFKLYDGDIGIGDEGIVLGSDEHEYLLFNNRSNQKSVEHYIDCVKCIERTKTQDSLKQK